MPCRGQSGADTVTDSTQAAPHGCRGQPDGVTSCGKCSAAWPTTKAASPAPNVIRPPSLCISYLYRYRYDTNREPPPPRHPARELGFPLAVVVLVHGCYAAQHPGNPRRCCVIWCWRITGNDVPSWCRPGAWMPWCWLFSCSGPMKLTGQPHHVSDIQTASAAP